MTKFTSEEIFNKHPNDIAERIAELIIYFTIAAVFLSGKLL